MGRATNVAIEQMELRSPREMRAGICVKDSEENKFFDTYHFNSAVYGEENYDHVERILINQLNNRFDQLASLPNTSRIVIVCRWSPCVICTQSVIPNLMDSLAELNKTMVQVKFRFGEYYLLDRYVAATATEKKNNGEFWPNPGVAQKVYNHLEAEYGKIEGLFDGKDFRAWLKDDRPSFGAFSGMLDANVWKTKSRGRLSITPIALP